MKRILVPTDFSTQAENALKVAAQLAHKNGSAIYLEHSLNMPSHLNDMGQTGTLPESLYFIRLAENEFEKLLKKPYLQDIEIHQAIGHGEIYDDIKETVQQKNIDIVVMGSHGLSGFKEMLFVVILKK